MVGLPCPTCVNQDKNPLCNAKNMPCGIVGCAPMLCYTDMETPGTGDIWVGKLGEPVPYDYGGSCGYAASCLGCIPNISVWAKKDPASCLAGCLTCPVKCLGSASVCGTSCCRPWCVTFQPPKRDRGAPSALKKKIKTVKEKSARLTRPVPLHSSQPNLLRADLRRMLLQTSQVLQVQLQPVLQVLPLRLWL